MDRQEKILIQLGGEYQSNEKLREVDSHPASEINDNELTREDADGNKQTYSHTHKDEEEITHEELEELEEESQEFENAVQEVMDRARLTDKEEVEERLKELIEQENLSLEEAVEEYIEIADREYREAMGMQTRDRTQH